MNDSNLTHFDNAGQAHMVDVGAKAETARVARAAGSIFMQPATLALIRDGSAKKGDVLGIARIAAIQASKRTGDLIPLCHPIALTRVAVEFTIDEAQSAIHCEVTAECYGRTGVEMEALTATSVGLLTIYDMAKAVTVACVSTIFVCWKKQAANPATGWLNNPTPHNHARTTQKTP